VTRLRRDPLFEDEGSPPGHGYSAGLLRLDVRFGLEECRTIVRHSPGLDEKDPE
jgi:hypothetical protein